MCYRTRGPKREGTLADHHLHPPWAALPAACLAQVYSHLALADRRAFRAACTAWQHAADDTARRAAFVCHWLPPLAPSEGRLTHFMRGRHLFPALRSLDLVELLPGGASVLADLVKALSPAAFPHLEDLGMSTLLGERDGTERGLLARLALQPQLRRLRLCGLCLGPGSGRWSFASITHLSALTELSVSVQLCQDSGAPLASSVSALTALPSLQASVCVGAGCRGTYRPARRLLSGP